MIKMAAEEQSEDWIIDSLEQDYLENLAELQQKLLFKQQTIEKQALKIQELELRMLGDKQRLQKSFQEILLREYLHHQRQFLHTMDALKQMRMLQQATEAKVKL
jgi:hypothetical protein